ncbi:RPII140-upstream gene protein [Parasteatoda tepidariorum]|uniref:RPII140-upstream gene protein n=1 Tax=Parasteatoda tepidariorum TaxID=114398 RepID=UPI00077F8AC6|nr:RPII140-upstream gene protein [Parasteatoda tepidariorum]
MVLIKFVECSDGKSTYIEQSGVKYVLSNETGKERVKRMFSKSDIGFLSPELRYVIKSGTFCLALAGIYGGMSSMKQAKEDFMRRNVASTFESQHFARRALVDTMSLAGAKGAYKYAMQYGMFSSVYLLTTMTVENYRNKISIWEHMGTGALLGGISRWKFGAKGMLAATVLGGVLGSVAGGLILLNAWLTGTDYEDFRYWHHEQYYTEVLNRKADE